MLNCKQITELCSAELERPLGLGEKVSMHMHLMMCAGCTRYRRQMTMLRRMMQAYAEGKAVGTDAEPGSSD